MDSDNIPDEEMAAAVAVGASMIEDWSTVPASLWSGLTDGVVSCHDCYPIMGCPASFSNFKPGARDLDGQYSTDLHLIFVFFFHLFAQLIVGHVTAHHAN